MEKERIEIFPGHWIEVTPRIKRLAGIRPTERVIATLAGGHITKAKYEAGKVRGAKYSRLLLDEAVELAKSVGYPTAAKMTGVNKNSIHMHARIQKGRAGLASRKDGSRYTLAQKQACVRLAQSLMASDETKDKKCRWGVQKVRKWQHRPAFIEAGRRLGMNGRSIEWLWVSGQIPLDSPSSPQSPVPPGEASGRHTPPPSG